jgi:hypothetical protein
MSNKKNLKRFRGPKEENLIGLGNQARSIFTDSALKRQSLRLAGKPAPVPFNNEAMNEAARGMDNTGEGDDNNAEEAGPRGEEMSQIAPAGSRAQEEEPSPTSSVSSISAPIRKKSTLKVVAVHDTAPILTKLEGHAVQEWAQKMRHFLAKGTAYRSAVDCITAKLHSSISDMVAAIFDDETANNWTSAGDEELLRFLETNYPPGQKSSDLESQLKKAANFKYFKSDDKSSATEIISRINEVMDRFQEEKEDVERQKTLAKLLIDNIGKSTKALAALQDFMKRASVPQTVAEFNRKLI